MRKPLDYIFPDPPSGVDPQALNQNAIPRHVAVIMDGNGRWAKKRALNRLRGHKAGIEAVRETIRCANDLGVDYLTIYSFSTENWKRPEEEVGALMGLFKQYLKDALEDLLNDDIKIRFLGDTSMFSADLQELIAQTIETGKTRTGMVLNLAMNYGSRAEITRAAQNLAEQVKNGTLQPSEITEQMLSDHMYTYGEPDPDLIIRPSGECRLSYSELIFMDVLWPDFTTEDLEHCLDEYAKRNRRFGGV